jgi:hypothetical protein
LKKARLHALAQPGESRLESFDGATGFRRECDAGPPVAVFRLKQCAVCLGQRGEAFVEQSNERIVRCRPTTRPE